MLSADQQLLSTTKFLEISLSYKYLLANKSIYDNLLKQSDPAYFKERLISLDTQEAVEEMDCEISGESISFRCRQCKAQVILITVVAVVDDDNGDTCEEKLVECQCCSLVYCANIA